MPTIRGFVTQSSYINNVPGTVAEFFELSPIALTYSMSRGEYQDALFPGYLLHAFKAIDDAGVKIVLTSQQTQEIFAVVKAVITYMTAAVYPYNLEDLQQSIQAEFSTTIKSFVPGVLHVGPTITLPTFLTWESVSDNAKIKIWTRNISFESQYSDCDVVVVPPLDSLDTFFEAYGGVSTKLQAIDVTDTFDRIQDFKADIPETFTRGYSFNYVNRSNPTQKTPATWAVLGYGRNGDNVDAIKNALIAYCLDNSSHPQATWEQIFPELFQRTEFLFCPRWDLVSIENLTMTSALYRSTIDPIEAIGFAKTFWSTETAAWIEANLTILPFDYKCLSVLALNGSTNSDDARSLTKLFPDYLPVSTSSVDFNRMTIKTREWVLMMVKLLKVAETADEYTTVENPMRKTTRNGILYISQVYEEVNYLVACAKSVGA